MLTINNENAKSIRTPFQVHCGMKSRENIALTHSVSGSAVQDTNITETLNDTVYIMRQLADLSGQGFSLDGSCEWLDTTLSADVDTGKFGARTTVGGSMTITVTGKKVINSLTVCVSDGTGQISCNGRTYTISRLVVVSVNSTSATLTIKANEGTRVAVESITAGFSVEFNNENLVSCTLALRSDYTLTEASWQTSDIEIQGYYPNANIASIIANIGEGAPITYYAGYEGDYSEVRTFYLSEKATYKDNVLTLKGEDISAKLNDKTYYSTLKYWYRYYAKKGLYKWFRDTITNALKGYRVVSESEPSNDGSNTSTSWFAINEITIAEFVMQLERYAGDSTYQLCFTDAGIPTITWRPKGYRWTINEEDVSGLECSYDQQLNYMYSTNDYALNSKIAVAGSNSTIESNEYKKDEVVELSFDTYVYNPTVSNAGVIKASATGISFKAKKAGKCNVKGRTASVSRRAKPDSINRSGVTYAIDTKVNGCLYKGDGSVLFPRYSRLFDWDNCSGKFTFKGDPRMQPNDGFLFRRLNGIIEKCRISAINLTHSGGGTSAEIEYRKEG